MSFKQRFWSTPLRKVATLATAAVIGYGTFASNSMGSCPPLWVHKTGNSGGAVVALYTRIDEGATFNGPIFSVVVNNEGTVNGVITAPVILNRGYLNGATASIYYDNDSSGRASSFNIAGCADNSGAENSVTLALGGTNTGERTGVFVGVISLSEGGYLTGLEASVLNAGIGDKNTLSKRGMQRGLQIGVVNVADIVRYDQPLLQIGAFNAIGVGGRHKYNLLVNEEGIFSHNVKDSSFVWGQRLPEPPKQQTSYSYGGGLF